MKNRTVIYSLRFVMIALSLYFLVIAGIDFTNFIFRALNSMFELDLRRIIILSEKGLAPLYYYSPAILVAILYFVMPNHRKDLNIKAIAVASAVIPIAIALWFRIPTY